MSSSSTMPLYNTSRSSSVDEDNNNSKNNISVWILLYLLAGIVYSIYMIVTLDVGSTSRPGFFKFVLYPAVAGFVIPFWPLVGLIHMLSGMKTTTK